MRQNKKFMKHILFTIVLLFSLSFSAQKPCEIGTNITDSIGTYKATKGYLRYEKNFAEKSSYIFAPLVLADGIPALTIQSIEKSKDFIKAICFDKNSKISLQLMDGNIVTLGPIIHNPQMVQQLADEGGVMVSKAYSPFSLNSL